MIEYTFVILKPDAVARGLTGKIIQRFEDAGLQICHLGYVEQAEEKMLRSHYNKDDAWKTKIGGFVKGDYEKMGLNAKDIFGTDEPIKLGQIVIDQLIDYMQAGPLIPMILKGYNAVKVVRKLVGSTYPNEADPSSIRGQYSSDSKEIAALERRSVVNLVHASGEVSEAKDEISLWVPDFDLTGGSCAHGSRQCCGGGCGC
ncbi:MAG: nucleoside-diphosphate kinase [Alphaproteobacteria bacterium]|nr:nucleoside-diphosphate kinase [Alphaproteobacteria bacterium]